MRWGLLVCRRSSSLEVQGKYGAKYGDEEQQGILASHGDGGERSLTTAAAPAPAKAAYQDEEGILPVILEDYLERAGVM